jgi:hypothetical protein
MCHRPARRGHRSAPWAVSIEVRIQWSDALHERLDAMPDAWGRDELGLLQGLRHVFLAKTDPEKAIAIAKATIERLRETLKGL